MKTSDVFKISYGVTLGFMCAKITVKYGLHTIEKLCDIGMDKIGKLDKDKDIRYKPYYTNEKRETCTLEEDPDGSMKVTCSSKKMLYDLLENVDSMIDRYGFFSVLNLKDLTGFKSECADVEIGWTDKDSYNMDWKGNSILFTKPIDISDLSCEPSCDLDEEEEETDAVEASK